METDFYFRAYQGSRRDVYFFARSSFRVTKLPAGFDFGRFTLEAFRPKEEERRIRCVRRSETYHANAGRPKFSLAHDVPCPCARYVFEDCARYPNVPRAVANTNFPNGNLRKEGNAPICFFQSIRFFCYVGDLPSNSKLRQ